MLLLYAPSCEIDASLPYHASVLDMRCSLHKDFIRPYALLNPLVASSCCERFTQHLISSLQALFCARSYIVGSIRSASTCDMLLCQTSTTVDKQLSSAARAFPDCNVPILMIKMDSLLHFRHLSSDK